MGNLKEKTDKSVTIYIEPHYFFPCFFLSFMARKVKLSHFSEIALMSFSTLFLRDIGLAQNSLQLICRTGSVLGNSGIRGDKNKCFVREKSQRAVQDSSLSVNQNGHARLFRHNRSGQYMKYAPQLFSYQAILYFPSIWTTKHNSSTISIFQLC